MVVIFLLSVGFELERIYGQRNKSTGTGGGQWRKVPGLQGSFLTDSSVGAPHF